MKTDIHLKQKEQLTIICYLVWPPKAALFRQRDIVPKKTNMHEWMKLSIDTVFNQWPNPVLI
jgi:hypothetical protein